MNKVFAQYTTRVSELRSNMKEVLSTAKTSPVAVTNHSDTECYLVPAKMFEDMVDTIASNKKPSLQGDEGQFRPNSIRMKEIADNCAAALQNTSNDDLHEYSVY